MQDGNMSTTSHAQGKSIFFHREGALPPHARGMTPRRADRASHSWTTGGILKISKRTYRKAHLLLHGAALLHRGALLHGLAGLHGLRGRLLGRGLLHGALHRHCGCGLVFCFATKIFFPTALMSFGHEDFS